MVQKRKREEKNCKKFSSKQKYIIVIAWIYIYTQYSRTKKKRKEKFQRRIRGKRNRIISS